MGKEYTHHLNHCAEITIFKAVSTTSNPKILNISCSNQTSGGSIAVKNGKGSQSLPVSNNNPPSEGQFGVDCGHDVTLHFQGAPNSTVTVITSFE